MPAARIHIVGTRGRGTGEAPASVEAWLGSYVTFAASPGQTADDNSGERNGCYPKVT